MSRRDLLIAAFVASRIIMGFVADHPSVYPAGSADATSDLAQYAYVAEEVHGNDRTPYQDVHVGYPPGSLPIMLIPYMLGDGDYRPPFVALSVFFDAMGLWAMYRFSRRRGSWWGAVAWLVLLPLLGPVAYTRLDMAVATCIAWAVERLDAKRWAASALLLGVGAAIKVTPALILPIIVIGSPKRWRVAAAAVAGGAIFLVPSLPVLADVYDEVMAGNVDRGVHAESLWGSLALLGRVVGGITAEVVTAFGASDIQASYVPALKSFSNALAVGVLLASVAFTALRVRRNDADHIILVAAGTFVMLTAVGRVFSPQYLAWLVPLVGASLVVSPRRMRLPAALFAASVGLAHVVYPVFFWDYLEADAFAVTLGASRNVALLSAALVASRVAWQYGRSTSPPEEGFPGPTTTLMPRDALDAAGFPVPKDELEPPPA